MVILVKRGSQVNKVDDMSYVLESLRNNTCVVEFTKKNGEFRKMRCTTDANKIPGYDIPEEGIALTSETHSAVKCYDVEAQGWRSFIIENVLKFSLVEVANDF